MRRYHVSHRTEYRYTQPVAVGHTTARLVPRALPFQRVSGSTVTVDPPPSHRHEHIDGFGKAVTYVAIDEPHEHLVVTATSDIDLDPRPEPGAAWEWPWEDVAVSTLADTSEDGLLGRICRLDSPLIARDPALAELAGEAFVPGRPIGEAAADLTGRIHAGFEFVPGATDVTTPVLEVLAERRGVCQDFAHVLLGALRSIGLAARYVSGYLETQPPPGQARLIGADASHAWVGVLLPGWGWVDLDPTNGLVQPDRHVTVAWGRDYTDVVPVRGIVFGPPAAQVLIVSVDVAPRDG
jgi:transglutaminase-like putative cysteine protease